MSFAQRIAPLFALTLACLWPVDRAEADPSAVAEIALSVGKEAASAAAIWVVGEIYDSNCGSADQPKDLSGIDAFLCSSMRSVSGRDEDEFRDEVTTGLAEIKEVVARIETGISELIDGQAQILAALKVVDNKIDAIAQESAVTSARSIINSLWNDRFKLLANGQRSFTSTDNLAMAREIVFSDRIDRQLGILSEILTEPGVGNKPSLLEQQMTILLSKLDLTKSSDLALPHNLYQVMMTRVLLDYARGEMMVAWALNVLDAHCTSLTERGETCEALPISPQNFASVAQGHRSKILDTYRTQSERMVMAFANTASTSRNFLNEDTEQVLIATDFFLAMHDETRRGIRGRVISAGGAFDGMLTISGYGYTSAAPRSIPATADIDWWTRPSPSQPYDRVHFAPNWRIYDFAPPITVTEQRIQTQLPWHSGPFAAQKFDSRNGTLATADTPAEFAMEFGHFTATARAGGAYAFMDQAWFGLFESSTGSDNDGNRTNPSVSASWSGTAKYNPNRTFEGKDGSLTSHDRTSTVRRSTPITLVDGGNITFHGIFGDAEAIRAGRTTGARRPEIATDAVTYYTTNFRDNFLTANSSVRLIAGVYFSTQFGERGISWRSETEISAPITGGENHGGNGSVTQKYDDGQSINVRIAATMIAEIHSTALDPTTYTLFAGIAPTAIYITRN